MPHIQITLRKGRTPEQKQNIAKRMADVLVEEAGAKRGWISLSIIEIDDDGFAVGGSLVRDLKKHEEKT
ncbi:MAG: tautomerase family protein [Candidatus Methylomirabilales bacterium]